MIDISAPLQVSKSVYWVDTSGRAYGYRAVPGRPGELEIIEEEASVVRRIFVTNGRPSKLRIFVLSMIRRGNKRDV